MTSGALLEGGGAGHGIFPGLTRVRVRFTEAATAGDLVMFDLAATASGLSYAPGGDPGDSVWNTVRQPDAASGAKKNLEAGFFGLAEETEGAGDDGWVTIRTPHFVGANVDGSTTEGDYLVPQAGSGQLALADTTTPTQGKIVAIAREADASNLADVVFNGIEGFGQDV